MADKKKRMKASSPSEFYQIAEFIPGAVFELDAQGIITYANREGLEIFGYERDEVQGVKSALEMFSPAERENISSSIAKNLKGEDLRGNEHYALRKNGTLFPVLVYSSPIKQGEKYVGVRGILVDITGIKESQNLIEKRDQLLHQVETLAKIGGWEMDLTRDGEATWTRGTYEIVGIDPGQPVPGYKEHIDWYLPEFRELVREKIDDLIRTGKPMTYEAKLKAADGQIKWGKAFGVSDEKDGRVVKIRGTFQDITELKQAQIQVAQLAKFPEENPNPVLRLNEAGRIIFANKSSRPLLDFWNTKEGEILPPFWKKRATESLESGRSCSYEEDIGQLVFYLTLAPIPEMGYLNIYGYDITERKRVENMVQQSEERYRITAQKTGQLVYDYDPRTGKIKWGGAVEALTGRSLEELQDFDIEDWAENVHEQDRPLALKALADAQKACSSYDVEYRFRQKSGKYLFVEEHGVFLPDPEGRAFRMLGSINNITDRKRAEEERKRIEKHYQQTQKLDSIGRLAGGVAHDLNNLLVPIIGYAQMLLECTEKEDHRRESEEEILKAGLRARDLVHQLLAFSRKQNLVYDLVDLNKVLADFKNLLRRTIREDVHIDIISSSQPLTVQADIGQLEQVMMNLAVNAADSMPNGGDLTIETAQVELDEEYARTHKGVEPGFYALLAVSDTGEGMDKQTVTQIFEPFFSTKKEDGIGLGLATVYGIIKQHGGNIWVYSEPGQGSCIKIYLPLSSSNRPPIPTQEPKIKSELKGTEIILLVEDNASVRRLAKSILEKQGYRVIPAGNSDEALALIQEPVDSLDLLLTDVVMPGLNGKDLHEKLTKTYPGLKVLYMSGYTDNVIAHHGILDEGISFIQKPFTVNGLATKVRQVLDQ